MDLWFEIVITVFLILLLPLEIIKVGMLIDLVEGNNEEVPELSEEMRRKLYS